MLRFQVIPALSKIINLDLKLVQQPVRTYRDRVNNRSSRAQDVRPKEEISITPPPGVGLYVYNRNPRNLERLSIANKGHGWQMDKDGRTYWHKLVVTCSKFGLKVSCVHQNGQVVMSASSGEWCIRKFIPKKADTCAYTIVGRIFAERCLRSGLSEMYNGYGVTEGKLGLLLKQIQDGGVILKEPIQMRYVNPTTKVKPTRPWDIIVE